MEPPPELRILPPSQAPQPAAPAKAAASHPAGIVILCTYILAVLAAGILLRQWTWRAAAPIRFPDDIQNGLFWGEQVVLNGRRIAPGKNSQDTLPGFYQGYTSLYDYHNVPGQIYELDYAPLRLLVMSLWAEYSGMPPRGRGTDAFTFAGPLLLLNTVCELASASAIFLLVRAWLARCAATARPGWFRRRFPRRYITVCGLAAATVAWFEPAMIIDAHGWPQWDAWNLPFYLFAALSMVNGRWLLCGALLAIGGMLKPQILIVAPFFVFVPLWGGQWRHALRVLAGFALAAGLIVLPWLVCSLMGWTCLIEAALLCAAIFVVRKKALLEGGSWLFLRNVKPGETSLWCFLVFAAAIWIAGWFCGGDFAWLRAGFLQTARTSPQLAEPSVWSNLPALLVKHRWALDDHFAGFDIARWHAEITLRIALRLAYVAALLLCSWGAARHLRRRDPRLLVSLALPWLLMFALMGQMHSRYLLWGAVASSLAFAVSIRLSLVHFIFSAAGTAMVLTRLNEGRNVPALRPALDFIARIKPDAPYILLAAVAVWFWFSLWRSRPMPPAPA